MLSINNLSKENGRQIILNNISINIENGEFVCFVGPSGSGKTALLRIIAGLEGFDRGTIALNGEDISRLSPFERNVCTIFNSFSLFPHLNVIENIKFGLNFRKISEKEKNKVVNEAIDYFELGKYANLEINKVDRTIKYKISLARALVNNPAILLLDDSLRLLYNKDRVKMRYELKMLQNSLNKTFIYITDDLDTAFSLGDRIGILQNGVLHQFDIPRIIYENPATFFVAGFIGNMNFFYARIKGVVDGNYLVEIDDKVSIIVPKAREFDKNSEIFFAIKAERIEISSEEGNDGSEINILSGKVIYKSYNAEYMLYYIELNYGKIVVASALNYNIGIKVEEIPVFEVGAEVFLKWNVSSGVLVYA